MVTMLLHVYCIGKDQLAALSSFTSAKVCHKHFIINIDGDPSLICAEFV